MSSSTYAPFVKWFLIACIVIAFISVVFYSEKKETAVIDYTLLVKDSDDYSKYSQNFAKAAKKLIDDNTCSEEDFKEMGGWLKSTNHSNEPIYFTYCGGMRLENKIYLNTSTNELYKE